MVEKREPKLAIVCNCSKVKKVIGKLAESIVGVNCDCNVFYEDEKGMGIGPLAHIKLHQGEIELLEY